jgi:multiphosphoryl transfer protein
MVGIVIVSHSAKLAEGVRELAQQMAADVPIAVAGGIDDPEQPIGTDPMAVLAAIESVYHDDGVLVLMDLGSALLSTDMALEMLDPALSEHVRMCAAPLVEGAVAAAVQAAAGGSLDAVCAEATGALLAKQQQMPGAAESVAAAASEAALLDTAAVAQDVTIRNRLGLHARPAARFVTTANRFDAAIRVRKHGAPGDANAKSINQVATLGARQNDCITISASGSDAATAVSELVALIESGFGEMEAEVEAFEAAGEVAGAPAAATAAAPDALQGIPASPGTAVGPAVTYRPVLPEVEVRTVDDPAHEWHRFQAAVAAALDEISVLTAQTTTQAGQAEAAIFEAHALFLEDPALLDRVEATIRGEHRNAEAAWQEAIEETADRFRALDDDYMRARAADALDVGQRVLGHLLDAPLTMPTFAAPSILVAADLTPSDTAQLEPGMVLGICTERGGATAHSAILARALGIPAVVGAGPALQRVESGQLVGIDGSSGKVWLAPDQERLAALREEQAAWQESQVAAQRAGQQPGRTADGQRVEIAANIGSPKDVTTALAYGAEGVGLFRTEFLFLNRDEAPGEDEQFAAYRAAADALGDRPLIIRTLDIGGDKPLPYLSQRSEDNPFLGWRGIRFCLDNPDLFRTQLRAILRVGHERNVLAMLPMVSQLEEITATRRLLAAAGRELEARGVPFAAEVPLGIMIEVPAAVALADILATAVDFFSIGTNDLTQYTMAADRGNAQVAALANALQPAVLRQVAATVRAADAAGIWVGVCGELAGNPLAAPLLVGLGVAELSMSGPAIPAVKQALSRITVAEARELGQQALALASAGAVERFLQQELAA